MACLGTMFVSSLSAQQRTGFEITDITASLVRTPDIEYKGETRRTPPPKQWFEVEVTFATEVDFTEEITVKYYMYFEDAVSQSGGNQGRLLVGEVTHVDIVKGKDKRSVVYVSPNTLERIMGGKSFSVNKVKPIGVQILRQGQVVAEKSTSGAPAGAWWTQVPNEAGMVLNKSETPFASLFWDRYEAIKSTR